MNDEQDVAESVDEEMVGTDAVTSGEGGAFDDAPDHPVGLPFADTDTTDESLAERASRDVPEIVDDPSLPLRLWSRVFRRQRPARKTSTRVVTSPSRTDTRAGVPRRHLRVRALSLGGWGQVSPSAFRAAHSASMSAKT